MNAMAVTGQDRLSQRRFGAGSLMLRHVIILVLLLLAPVSTANVSFGFTGVSGITVDGNKILFDGRDVALKGMIIQAFLYHDEELEKCKAADDFCARLLEAQDFFFARGKYQGKGALDVAKDWNADTIRFNANQGALDASGSYYSPAYVADLVSAVELARKQGFAVIVSLFDGRNKQAPEQLRSRNPLTPLNNQTSLGAAATLAQKFGNDTGVMIELLNESWSPVGRRKGWKLWLSGGKAPRGKFAGKTFVGVNEMIAKIRAEGAKNVIILQGLKASFRDFPGGLQDPLNRVAFAAHPFLGKGDTERLNWDGNFGDFAKDHPFIITAWNNPAKKEWCNKLGLQKPKEFLDYLKSKRIGVIAYALDVPGRVLVDFRESLEKVAGYGDSCDDGGAAGELIKEYFAAN